MKSLAFAVAASLAAVAALPASAAPTVVTFEGLANQVSIDNYYNGGTASDGTSGANLGVAFNGFFSFTGGGNPASTVGYNSTATAYGNVAAGFSSLSFLYGFLSAGSVSVYSGLNGAGILLGSVNYPRNIASTASAFSPGSVTFAGIGRSFAVTGVAGDDALDNITLNAVAVPEPASWALMIAGFGLVGGAMRRRQKLSIRFG